MINTNILKP